MIELLTNILLPILVLAGAVFGGVRYGKKSEQKKIAEKQNEVLKEHAEIDNSPDIGNPLDEL